MEGPYQLISRLLCGWRIRHTFIASMLCRVGERIMSADFPTTKSQEIPSDRVSKTPSFLSAGETRASEKPEDRMASKQASLPKHD
jgi:hypothetical protein